MDGTLRIGCLCRWARPLVVTAALASTVAAADARPQAGGGSKGESLPGSTATAASKRGATGGGAKSAAGRAKRSSCYAEVASAGHALRFSPAPVAAGASVSLSIRSYRRPVLIAQAPTCAPHVIVGHTYRAGLRYSSSAASVSLEVLAHTARGWSVSYVAIARLKPAKHMTSVSVVLHPIQGGVDRVALGLLVKAHGSLH